MISREYKSLVMQFYREQMSRGGNEQIGLINPFEWIVEREFLSPADRVATFRMWLSEKKDLYQVEVDSADAKLEADKATKRAAIATLAAAEVELDAQKK